MSHNPTAADDRLRKAAILVASLDASTADALLDRMPPEQSARIRRLIMELGETDAAEEQRVFEEFSQAGQPAEAGVELDPELAQRFGQTTAARAAAPLESPTYGPPTPNPSSLQALSQLPPGALVRRLEGEHPQIIAVVAAHLPPAQAAELLGALPHNLQSAVVRRLVDLDLADPSIVHEIANELESTLVAEKHAQRRRTAGHSALAEILQAASRENRRRLLSSVEQEDRHLAEQIEAQSKLLQVTPAWAQRRNAPSHSPATVRMQRDVKPRESIAIHPTETTPPARLNPEITPLPVEFDDLAQLDDRALGRVLQTAGPQVALLALAGASPEFVSRMLRPLPPAEARQLRQRLEQLGPVRLREIEAAQAELARVAGILAARGELKIVRRTPFAAAA